MKNKGLKERVEDVLADPTISNYMPQYLESVLRNMQQSSDKFHNTLLLIVFLIAVFELVSRAAVAEVTLGPFKIADMSILQKLIPVVVAYYYYISCSMLAMVGAQRALIDAILTKTYRKLTDNDLEYYLYPISPFVVESLLQSTLTGKTISLIGWLGVPVQLAIYFLPVFFQIYAFYKCFWLFGPNSILVWASLILSLLFSIQGMLLFFNWTRVK